MKAQNLAVAIFFVTGCGASVADNANNTPRPATLAALAGASTSGQCPNGGNLLNYGIDANGNGKLDSDEVQGQFNVCNGAEGKAGPQGPNGIDALPSFGWVDSADEPVPLFSSNVLTNNWTYLDTNTTFLWNVSYTPSNGNYLVGPTGIPFPSPAVYYASPDCTGPSYLASVTPGSTVTGLSNAENPNVADPNTYGVPQDTNYVPVAIQSSFTPFSPFPGGSSGCGSYSNSAKYIARASLVQTVPPPLPGTPPYRPAFR